MEKIKGIQDLVYDIIEAYTENKDPIISKKQIKTELMTAEDLKELNREKHKNDNVTKLDRALDQALYQLKKNNKIKTNTHGFWMVTTKKIYSPKPCKALIPYYLFKCSCGYMTSQKSEKRPEKIRCPDCNHMIIPELFQFYCPVRKTFIGSPTAQCELLHGTDYAKMKKKVDPMKVCYFAKKPTSLGLQYAKRKIRLYDQRQHEMMLPASKGF